jgi:hypothetical protein
MNKKAPPEEIEHLIEQSKMLIQRLERISADSIWARRSSGHRGALLKWVDAYERNSGTNGGNQAGQVDDIDALKRMIAASYKLLEKAAREYPEQEQ